MSRVHKDSIIRPEYLERSDSPDAYGERLFVASTEQTFLKIISIFLPEGITILRIFSP